VAKARDDYHRDIKVMTYGLVVCRDTETETQAAFQQVVEEGAPQFEVIGVGELVGRAER
jgi:hypothetical protein